MLCFVFAALVVLLDQFIKRWVVLTLALNENMDLIPGVVGLTHYENTGAAFSILSGQRWLLAGIALIAALVLIFILLRYNEGFWGTLGLSAVLGGAVGNMIDRIFNGYVVDMFIPQFINFAIFNVADIFITLGGITFCIFFIITSFRSPDRLGATGGLADEDSYGDSDEQGDYTDWQDEGDIDEFSDTKVIPSRQRPSEYVSQTADPPSPAEQENYFGEYPPQEERFEIDTGQSYEYNTDPSQEVAFNVGQILGDDADSGTEQPVAFEALSDQPEYNEPADKPSEDFVSTLEALDSLETELSMLDDYDVDDLLKEYGFEDDGD